MLSFSYLCYTEVDPYRSDSGRQSVWCVFYAEDFIDGGTCAYLAWGSPKKPIIRQYYPANRNETISTRIKEKRQSWKHQNVELKDIRTKFPVLVSEIEQYLVVRKLRSV